MPKKKKKKRASKPAKMGAPTKFTEKLALRILSLAGRTNPPLTDEQIADEVGIGWTTLKNWKADKPDFRTAFKSCRDVAAELVEGAMFQKATGYRHRAVKIHYDKDTGQFVTHEYVEQVPPDTEAGKFLLKNWKPEEYKDRHDLGGKLGDSLADLIMQSKALPEEEK